MLKLDEISHLQSQIYKKEEKIMHDGCAGSFENGQQVVDKVRMMGFSQQLMPMPLDIECHGCKETFTMEEFEGHCPKCDMVHGVTPCHAFDPNNIMAAGVGY